MQLNHQQSIFEKKSFPITLICDGITNTANIGSLLRIADAFSIEKIYFCGTEEQLTRKSKRTSRATENWVNYSFEKDAESLIKKLKSTHYIIGLEITDKSMSLQNLELITQKKIALVIGNENYGISDAILKFCNHIIHINMYGKNSSMNVAQATSITLYEITNQLKNYK